MSPDSDNEIQEHQTFRGETILAVVLVVLLTAGCAWVVKLLGPRPINPDNFCNCSVLEGLLAMVTVPLLAIACIIAGFALRRARGAQRAVGVVAGVASFALPVLALVASIYGTFPSVEELQGWTQLLRDLPRTPLI